jgi:hypothetical protein
MAPATSSPPHARPIPGRRRWLASLLLVSSSLVGCATSAARRAFDQGDYGGAAKLADEEVAAHPGDASAVAFRQRARDKEVETSCASVETFGGAGRGDAAIGVLDHVLREVGAWGGANGLSPPAQANLAETVGQARGFVTKLAEARPLTAEAELATLAPHLEHAELAGARDAVRGQIADAGKRNCAHLQAQLATDSPNWNLLVARYCTHFGVAGEPAHAARDAASATVTGTITGAAAEQIAQLREQVPRWLADSLWSRRADAGPMPAEVSGKLDVSIERRTVTLHASYTDKIKTETYDPSRKGIEGLFPAVGTTTMDRVYEYDADEARGRYALDGRVTFQTDRGGPVVVELRRTENLKAYDHDVTFEPAGVSPRHDTVPSSEAWLGAQITRSARPAVDALNRKFIATFCAAGRYAVEDAARCVAAGVAPDGALTALATAVGEDAPRLVAAVTPPAQISPPAPRAAPRRRPRPKQRGATDHEAPPEN